MNQKEFDVVAQELLDLAASIRNSKGKDYSEDNDRLSNFKTIARELEVTPFLVWAIYFRKHIDAIMKHTRKGQTESEPIEGRLADVLNYILLYYGLIKESAPVQYNKLIDPRLGDTSETNYILEREHTLPMLKGSRLNAAPIHITTETDADKKKQAYNDWLYKQRGGPGVD